MQASRLIDDLVKVRQEAANVTTKAQSQQTKYFNKRRKVATRYQVDLILIKKAPVGIEPGTSRKLVPKFQGPMVVTKVLPSDRYQVADMTDSRRTSRRTSYQSKIAADSMKPC